MTNMKPLSTSGHQPFKRTFLQQTEVVVKFSPALSAEAFRKGIISYLNSTFDLKLPENQDNDANHAEVQSNSAQEKFIFDLNQVQLVIGPISYKTFSETAIPLIVKIMEFLKGVAKVDTLDSLSIVKKNVWPFNAKDSYKDFTNMISYTFQEQHITDMMSYQPDSNNPQPIKLTKTSNNKIDENKTLDAVLSAEILSKEKVRLSLVLNASAKNILTNEIIQNACVLNDRLYDYFINVISDNIIDIMNRGE